jgi:hypothetical protein
MDEWARMVGHVAWGGGMAQALRVGDRGPAVKDLQAGANRIFRDMKFPWRVVEADGIFGEQTERAAHFAGWLIGFGRKELEEIEDGRVSAESCEILSGREKPSAEMDGRRKDRHETAKKLRHLHHKRDRKPDADGVGEFDGVPVAAWIVKWLEKSRKAGWKGEVVSGFRSPERSEEVCRDMCGQPSCPGRCAGRSSNHSGLIEPAGAVDLTDFDRFGAIQTRIGSPLRNDLPNDPVHFSTTGH